MGLKLLLAVSADGFLAKGPNDDMKWTGPADKAVFRLLTLTGGVLLAGRQTAQQLPPLPGRKVVALSRQHHLGLTLREAYWSTPQAWLIGGPSVAAEALRENMVERAFLCRTDAILGEGIPIGPLAALLPEVCTYRQKVAGIYVDVYTGLQERTRGGT
jgi:dihydrofolate reductase